MNSATMFSSKTGNWNTPQSLIDDLSEVFDWDCDVCADGPNVCEFYYDKEDNGLGQNWLGLCWCNPPYGRQIGQWVQKARESNATTVCLLPARTDTKWWQDNVIFASLVVFIRGRLRFEGASSSAPFPSAFVVFGKLNPRQKEQLITHGVYYENA